MAANDYDKCIELMKSADYKERFIGEVLELDIRMKKLQCMLDQYRNHTLDFEPDCPLYVLEEQYDAMKSLRAVLKLRADIEGIDIHYIFEEKNND